MSSNISIITDTKTGIKLQLKRFPDSPICSWQLAGIRRTSLQNKICSSTQCLMGTAGPIVVKLERDPLPIPKPYYPAFCDWKFLDLDPPVLISTKIWGRCQFSVDRCLPHGWMMMTNQLSFVKEVSLNGNCQP